jgi:hypothetical protein
MATSTSWLDLENFMRIFRQQGRSMARQKIRFSHRTPAQATKRRDSEIGYETPKHSQLLRGAASPSV